MTKKSRLLLVTCKDGPNDSSRVLWSDCSHDQVLQLPLCWGLHKCDLFLFIVHDVHVLALNGFIARAAVSV